MTSPHQTRPAFRAFVMVDWSASSRPGRAGGGADGLWAAVAEPGRPDRVHPFRTRTEAADWVIGALTRLLDAGHRVLCGFDLALGYPSGTAAGLGAPGGVEPWRWLWDLLDREVRDDPDNRNTRFAVAAELNARLGAAAGPFWGLPHGRALRHLSPTKTPFPITLGDGRRVAEYRHVEAHHRRRGGHPKSVWQLTGAGAVGSQALVGIPHVQRIREAPPLADRCRIWPFETGFTAPVVDPEAAAVIVEVYPSLLPADPSLHAVRDAAQVLALVDAYRQAQERGALAAAFGPPPVEAVVRDAAVREEGWILPVTGEPAPPVGAGS